MVKTIQVHLQSGTSVVHNLEFDNEKAFIEFFVPMMNDFLQLGNRTGWFHLDSPDVWYRCESIVAFTLLEPLPPESKQPIGFVPREQ